MELLLWNGTHNMTLSSRWEHNTRQTASSFAAHISSNVSTIFCSKDIWDVSIASTDSCELCTIPIIVKWSFKVRKTKTLHDEPMLALTRSHCRKLAAIFNFLMACRLILLRNETHCFSELCPIILVCHDVLEGCPKVIPTNTYSFLSIGLIKSRQVQFMCDVYFTKL